MVVDIAESVKHRGQVLNERHLHHCFSHLLQTRWNMLDLIGKEDEKITLHPEWPTYKKQTGLCYGRYRKENRKYLPNPKGTAGFIDFAVGEYKKPEVGVEFSVKYGWSNEEIVFDFLKLLHKENPFKTSISLNVIFRKNKLARGGYREDLDNHINEAYREAIRRLDKQVCAPESRDVYLIVTEIAQDNTRRHWHYDKRSKRFESELPQLTSSSMSTHEKTM